MALKKRGTGNNKGKYSNNPIENAAASELDHLIDHANILAQEYASASEQDKFNLLTQLNIARDAVVNTFESYQEVDFIQNKELKNEIEAFMSNFNKMNNKSLAIDNYADNVFANHVAKRFEHMGGRLTQPDNALYQMLTDTSMVRPFDNVKTGDQKQRYFGNAALKREFDKVWQQAEATFSELAASMPALPLPDNKEQREQLLKDISVKFMQVTNPLREEWFAIMQQERKGDKPSDDEMHAVINRALINYIFNAQNLDQYLQSKDSTKEAIGGFLRLFAMVYDKPDINAAFDNEFKKQLLAKTSRIDGMMLYTNMVGDEYLKQMLKDNEVKQRLTANMSAFTAEEKSDNKFLIKRLTQLIHPKMDKNRIKPKAVVRRMTNFIQVRRSTKKAPLELLAEKPSIETTLDRYIQDTLANLDELKAGRKQSLLLLNVNNIENMIKQIHHYAKDQQFDRAQAMAANLENETSKLLNLSQRLTASQRLSFHALPSKVGKITKELDRVKAINKQVKVEIAPKPMPWKKATPSAHQKSPSEKAGVHKSKSTSSFFSNVEQKRNYFERLSREQASDKPPIKPRGK